MINICLAEVEACQYFVGFLGSRYGWCPQRSDIARSTFTNFPFLNSYVPGHSATEMEILYGALGWGPKSRAVPRKAFFYHRSEVPVPSCIYCGAVHHTHHTYHTYHTHPRHAYHTVPAMLAMCAGLPRDGAAAADGDIQGAGHLHEPQAARPQGAHRRARQGVG